MHTLCCSEVCCSQQFIYHLSLVNHLFLESLLVRETGLKDVTIMCISVLDGSQLNWQKFWLGVEDSLVPAAQTVFTKVKPDMGLFDLPQQTKPKLLLLPHYTGRQHLPGVLCLSAPAGFSRHSITPARKTKTVFVFSHCRNTRRSLLLGKT